MQKRIIAILMSVTTLILCVSPLSVSAQTINNHDIDFSSLEEEYNIAAAKETFATMSIEELQDYINSIADTLYYTSEEVSFSSKPSPTLDSPHLAIPIVPPVITPINYRQMLKNAWLAAAAIARLMGYPAAATLVEHSVAGKKYIEFAESPFNTGSPLFKNKIITTNAYKSFIARPTVSITFEKNDNADLFFALHQCYCSLSTVNSKKTIYIEDKFDFPLLLRYDSPFVTIVNNWAFLNQMMGVLTDIKIYIAFYV